MYDVWCTKRLRSQYTLSKTFVAFIHSWDAKKWKNNKLQWLKYFPWKMRWTKLMEFIGKPLYGHLLYRNGPPTSWGIYAPPRSRGYAAVDKTTLIFSSKVGRSLGLLAQVRSLGAHSRGVWVRFTGQRNAHSGRNAISRPVVTNWVGMSCCWKKLSLMKALPNIENCTAHCIKAE